MIMNKLEVLDYIYDVPKTKPTSPLDRMSGILDCLGNPQDKLKIIHVSGTNGKGSCCAMLSSILITAGYKVGMFTSPHLIDPKERFVINGKQISEKDFIQTASKVKKAQEKVKVNLGMFDKLTAMCFEYFYKKKVDIAIIEVGIGGLLDSTNIIKSSLVSVIMNIGFDHIEILGNTISKIATQKAGIIKKKGTIVSYDNKPSAIKAIEKIAYEKNAKFIKADFKQIKVISEGIDKQEFDYKQYKNVELPLLGKHQFNNAATVLEVVEVLKKKKYKLDVDIVKKGIKNTKWLSRMSILQKDPLFILDGAHNPQCAKALCNSLPIILNGKKAIMLCGVLKDKDYKKVMDIVIPYAKEFICLTPNSHRALNNKELASLLKSKGQKAHLAKTCDEGIKLALKKAKKDDVIVGFGSLYLAGDIIKSYRQMKDGN